MYKHADANITKQLRSINHTLKPYQVDAVEFMGNIENEYKSTVEYSLPGGIICLEMGLGKTLIALFHALRNQSPKNKQQPTLVLCPKGALCTWVSEFVKFFCSEQDLAKDNDNFRNQTNGGPIITSNGVSLLWISNTWFRKNSDKVTCNYFKKFQIILINIELITHIARVNAIIETLNDQVKPLTKPVFYINELTDKGSPVLFGFPYHRIIADESQNFTKPDTQNFKVLTGLYSKYKWCLSGTPIRNSEMDLLAQFQFLNLSMTDSIHFTFNDQEKTDHRKQVMKKYIFELTYKKVDVVLPPCEIKRIWCKMDENTEKTYHYFRQQALEFLSDFKAGKTHYASVLKSFTRLRQICTAPFLVTPQSKNPDDGTDEDYVLEDEEKHATRRRTAEENARFNFKENPDMDADLVKWIQTRSSSAGHLSGKIVQLVKLVQSILKNDFLSKKKSATTAVASVDDVKDNDTTEQPPVDKIIIFSNWTSMLNLIQQVFKCKGFKKYVRFDGQDSVPKRNLILKSFRNDPDVRVLLMTYKVGAESLNLTVANHMILIEPWWCPAVIQQAKARIHRTGQTRPVTVYELVSVFSDFTGAPNLTTPVSATSLQSALSDKSEKEEKEPVKATRSTRKRSRKDEENIPGYTGLQVLEEEESQKKIKTTSTTKTNLNKSVIKAPTETIEQKMIDICIEKAKVSMEWIETPIYVEPSSSDMTKTIKHFGTLDQKTMRALLD